MAILPTLIQKEQVSDKIASSKTFDEKIAETKIEIAKLLVSQLENINADKDNN